MRYPSSHFDSLRADLEQLPLIDSHDHAHALGPNFTDAIRALFWGYTMDDMASASSEAERDFILDPARSLEERWPRLEKIWARFKYSGYGELTRRVMRKFYDEETLTLEALRRIQGRLLDVNDAGVYEGILADANIPLRIITGTIGWEMGDTRKFLAGKFISTPRGREVVLLHKFLQIRHRAAIEEIAALAHGQATPLASLEDYIGLCREIFTACKSRGAVGFKDIRAYHRSLACTDPSYAEAATVFDKLWRDPAYTADYPLELAPLEDYLIHAFMDIARDLDLPVQVHTGHLAGVRGDITRANAIAMLPLLERHRDTQFNLFHANWPYDGELLFIGKNYSNVLLDFCWTHIIDPVYSQRMLVQALSCMPHAKLHAFGADFGGFNVDKAWAHASMARDHIAAALCEMIELGRIDTDDARVIAADWMFHNVNRFLKLGLRFEDYVRTSPSSSRTITS